MLEKFSRDLFSLLLHMAKHRLEVGRVPEDNGSSHQIERGRSMSLGL